MSAEVAYAEVADRVPSVDRALAAVAAPSVGGVALFVGLVRGHDRERSVVGLDYSAHPTAVEELARCAREVADRHDVLRVAVEHRVGRLVVGDVAVVAAVGAAHRGDAFAACHDLVDTLKASVPIWKRQAFIDGTTEWVGL